MKKFFLFFVILMFFLTGCDNCNQVGNSNETEFLVIPILDPTNDEYKICLFYPENDILNVEINNANTFAGISKNNRIAFIRKDNSFVLMTTNSNIADSVLSFPIDVNDEIRNTVISPNGELVLFSNGFNKLYSIDYTGNTRLLSNNFYENSLPAFGNQGNNIVFYENEGKNIKVLDINFNLILNHNTNSDFKDNSFIRELFLIDDLIAYSNDDNQSLKVINLSGNEVKSFDGSIVFNPIITNDDRIFYIDSSKKKLIEKNILLNNDFEINLINEDISFFRVNQNSIIIGSNNPDNFNQKKLRLFKTNIVNSERKIINQFLISNDTDRGYWRQD